MHIADLDLDFLALSETEDGMDGLGEDDEVVEPEELGESDESSDDEEGEEM